MTVLNHATAGCGGRRLGGALFALPRIARVRSAECLLGVVAWALCKTYFWAWTTGCCYLEKPSRPVSLGVYLWQGPLGTVAPVIRWSGLYEGSGLELG